MHWQSIFPKLSRTHLRLVDVRKNMPGIYFRLRFPCIILIYWWKFVVFFSEFISFSRTLKSRWPFLPILRVCKIKRHWYSSFEYFSFSFSEYFFFKLDPVLENNVLLLERMQLSHHVPLVLAWENILYDTNRWKVEATQRRHDKW